MTDKEIRDAIISHLKEPQPLGMCSESIIIPDSQFKLSNGQFHRVWVNMIQNDELHFTEGGKNFGPIMVSFVSK